MDTQTEKNVPLNAQGIEQILKRNGLLKDNDIGRVLNVLAWRKELRSLKACTYTRSYLLLLHLYVLHVHSFTGTYLLHFFCEFRCVYVLML